jgi:TIGR03009 family protein
MPRRHKILVSTLVAFVAMGYGLVSAQDRTQAPANQARPAQAAARPAQTSKVFPQAAMDELLGQWEGQSAKLESLEIDIYRIDRDLAWGDEAHFTGHAAFKYPDLAYVDYRRVKLVAEPDPKIKNKKIFVPQKDKNGRLDTSPFETILCNGKEVWDYRSDVQQLVIFQLDNGARKKILNEGPLPFLFRMRTGDAKQRYHMVLQNQDAKESLVMINPNIKEDKDSFQTAWVRLDRKFLLPTRIVLVLPEKVKMQDFTLSRPRANLPVNEKFFVGVKPTKPWQIVVNPMGDAPSGAAAKGGRRLVEPKATRRPAADQGETQR